MKKTLLLLIILASAVYGQTAPSGYTTNYRIRQWASGANPSADSLNANWALIDSTIRYPRYVYADTIKAYTSRKIRFGSGDGLDTLAIYGRVDIVGALTAGSAAVEQYLSAGSAGGVDGGVRIYNALNGYYLELVGTAATSNKILTLPNLAGTFALVDGNQNLTDLGTVTADSLRISGNVSVGGKFYGDTLAGNWLVDGDLTADSVYVSGGASIGGALSVSGLASLSGGATVDGVLAVTDSIRTEDNVYVDGNVTVGQNLHVTGTSTLVGASTFSGTVTADSIHSGGGARIDGYVDVNNTVMADSISVGLVAIGLGDIYRDGTAYTNPDYVFEDYYTGESSNPEYDGLRPLSEVEAYTKENHRLPGIKDEPTGIFKRADFVLENIEKLYLYLIAQDKELKRLRSEVEALKGR